MDLREALQRDELTLVFQPQYDIGSGMACGVEALARWSPPRGAPVAPSVFVPLAEQTGLIDALGTWALRSGCRVSAEWMRQRHVPARLSVNVSVHQIRGGFTAEITRALDQSGLPPDQLELDITESILVTNPDLALSCLTQWKRLGVRIALDDFGTGHAGPAQVARLPVDRVKIDGSLIGGMTTRAQDAAMVRAVIALGREQGFTVLAEGVETEDQLRMLRELGCPQAQGYLLTPPTSADAACALLGQRWGARLTARDEHRTWQ
jgi:EAL domain-containing protein (putative c-di-GMP-specific phosphodiesterase class I)